MDEYTYKDDKGKTPYHLIHEFCIREMLNKNTKYAWAKAMHHFIDNEGMYVIADKILDVLLYGIKKYGKEGSWKKIDNAQDRYCAALLRHCRYIEDEIDEESGLPHNSHMLCNMYFLLFFEIMEDKEC